MKKSFDVFYGYWTVLINLGLNEKFSEKYNKYIIYLMKDNLKSMGMGTIIRNLYHLDFKFQNISRAYWVGCFFENNNFLNSVLIRIDFTRCYFSNIIFKKTTFESCDFSYARFYDLTLVETKINNCYFTDLNLEEVSFYNSELKRINFMNTKLNKANFSNCEIIESNFTNAELEGIILDGAILKDITIDERNKKYLEDRGIKFTVKEDNDDEIPF